MADAQSVAMLIDSTTSKIQQLQQAFVELESYSALSLNLKWKELEEHFHGFEKSLKKKFTELEDQEKEYVTKESETQVMLEKHEAAVVAKEQASLERLQEKRDDALYAILVKNKNYPSEPNNNGINVNMADTTVEEKSDVISAKIDLKNVMPAKNNNADVWPISHLRKLCEAMDAKGLHKFISDNHKNLASIREEIPIALRSAPHPFNMILDSLKDFYTGDNLNVEGKKDANLLGMRRTCLMLMECLAQLLEYAVLGFVSDNKMLTLDIKEQAKVIANEWKQKLDNLDIDASSGNSLEAHAFLQLLATFGIAPEFDQDEICKLILTVSRRRQTADLCRLLGLSQKMPGIIEILVNSGRQIEAINLAYAFELTERFPAVPLLKAYLKEARKVSQGKVGNMSPGQNEMNESELSALKAVIKSVEEHKLEEEYPVDPLQKRILQLENAKRRAAEAAKPQSKRPRAVCSTYAPRATTGYPEKSFYRAPERYSYSYERQYAYQAETHLAPLLPYTVSPTHTPYYGNGYQVQYPVPYLH